MRCCKRILALLLTALLVLPLTLAQSFAAGEQAYSTTILFTHDMHCHFLPTSDGQGGESGGFARLATLIHEQRAQYPDVLVLDGGDFSMGSLFQSIYSTEAPELRIMGKMGYDATTFGNHEFDFRQTGFASMLNAAVASGEDLPMILDANYYPPTPDAADYSAEDAAVWAAMEAYGVEEYTLLERGGVTYGIFGLMGDEADEDAPESGMVLGDPVETAQATVNAIRAAADPDQPLFIICLSHSGTSANSAESEDEILADKVEGIDVIISGHSHTVLEEPIQVEDTLIISSGCYTANLGVLDLRWSSDGSKTIERYELLPVDETVTEDPEIAAITEDYKTQVAEDYLSHFGFEGFDQVVGTNSVAFDSVDDLYAEHRESGLGDLIADSYLAAARENGLLDDGIPTFAVTACGVIRDTFSPGDITVSDVFNVSSLGVGTDGLAGYPLIYAYLTGKEIKAACEVDASVTPLMSAAQLHISGLRFTWNPYRMIFNKVSSVQVQNTDGSWSDLDDDGIYRVVTGLYCGQMLSAVKAQSFGILSITPKHADGTEVTNFDDCILYDANGSEVKEWYALADYIQSFPNGEIPATYENSASVERKVESRSLSPVALLKGASALTIAVICIVLVLILLLVLLIRAIVRRILFKRRYGKGASYSAYRKQHRKKVSKRKYGKFEHHGYDGPGKTE